MYRTILIFFLFINLSINLSAQKTRFYAQTDAKEIFTDSYLEVSFVLENDDGHSFRPPNFKGFKIVSGPNQSSQISISNGNRSSKEVFSYVVIASKPGIYIIQPAKMTVGKSVLKTNQIKVKVRKKDKNSTIDVASNKFFVRAELSDSIAYPGQQVVLKYKLYRSVNVSNYSFRKESNYEDFLSRSLNIKDKQERVIIGNSDYTVNTLKAIALFPQKTGKLVIDPANIVIHLPTNSRSNAFFRSTKPYPVSTDELTLRVLPLPENAPNDFSGNIGKFSIKSKIDNRSITTDDAFSLTVQIDGNGLIKFIEAPEFNESLKDFEVYDPKLVRQQEYISKGELFSRKTFEYLIVPKKSGSFYIKIPLNYFDIDSTKYITRFSRPERIIVNQGKNSNKKTKDNILSKYKLKPLMKGTTLKSKKEAFFGSTFYYLIILTLLLAIPIMYLYRRHLIKYNNLDPRIKKRNKAGKMAQKRLKKAKELMSENKVSLFYKEISDALLKYVSDKLDMSNFELSKTNVKSELNKLGFSIEKSADFNDLLEVCEMALFANSPSSDMVNVYENANELLTNLEMEL